MEGIIGQTLALMGQTTIHEGEKGKNKMDVNADNNPTHAHTRTLLHTITEGFSKLQESTLSPGVDERLAEMPSARSL